MRRPCSAERRERKLLILIKGRTTELAEIGRSEAQHAAPHQGSCPVLNSLLNREPVKNIAHVGGDVVVFGYTSNEAGC